MTKSTVFQNDGQSVHHMIGDIYMPACHIHNHNEMVFVLQGHLIIENNCDTMQIDAPALIIHNSFTIHRVVRCGQDDYDRYVVNFNDSVLDILPQLRETVGFFKNVNMTVIRLDSNMRDVLLHYMKRYSVVNESDNCQDYLTYMILYEIAQYRSNENTCVYKQKIPYINDIMQYISLHYNEPLTLDELASKYYYSRSKLVADFRSITGMTVKMYTTLVRINMARVMLMNGSSVHEAACTSGYNSRSSFIATFQKYFGVKPTEYRELAKKNVRQMDF